MRLRVRWITLSSLLATTVAATMVVVLPSPAGAAAPKAAEPEYYLALGDSLSVGVMPDSSGVNQPTNQGYVDELYTRAKLRYPGLEAASRREERTPPACSRAWARSPRTCRSSPRGSGSPPV